MPCSPDARSRRHRQHPERHARAGERQRLVAAAAEAGAAAIVVSNHGGRQLDGVLSSARALPAIADAVKGDLNTVVGFGFYQHGETPGLGGEVDNPKWKALWTGKTLFDEQGQLAVEIIKGSVDPQSAKATHQVDGLAGATLTSKGVNNLLHFWLGENGFGPLLANLKKGEA